MTESPFKRQKIDDSKEIDAYSSFNIKDVPEKYHDCIKAALESKINILLLRKPISVNKEDKKIAKTISKELNGRRQRKNCKKRLGKNNWMYWCLGCVQSKRCFFSLIEESKWMSLLEYYCEEKTNVDTGKYVGTFSNEIDSEQLSKFKVSNTIIKKQESSNNNNDSIIMPSDHENRVKTLSLNDAKYLFSLSETIGKDLFVNLATLIVQEEQSEQISIARQLRSFIEGYKSLNSSQSAPSTQIPFPSSQSLFNPPSQVSIQ